MSWWLVAIGRWAKRTHSGQSRPAIQWSVNEQMVDTAFSEGVSMASRDSPISQATCISEQLSHPWCTRFRLVGWLVHINKAAYQRVALAKKLQKRLGYDPVYLIYKK